VRRVQSRGEPLWRKRKVFPSKALWGALVGLDASNRLLALPSAQHSGPSADLIQSSAFASGGACFLRRVSRIVSILPASAP
jgi:hypothetical protein